MLKYGEEVAQKEMQKIKDNELLKAGLGQFDFLTDFPSDTVSKSDFKRIKHDSTFGNNKILTNKGFRPSYAVAEGELTKIILMPLKVIQDAIVMISNSGENKIKSEFFKQLPWFEAFGQSYKTKFNNAVTMKTFYPKQVIIEEGASTRFMYIIVQGNCNLVCRDTNQRIKELENNDDPTRAKRDLEIQKLKNPYKKETQKDQQLMQ